MKQLLCFLIFFFSLTGFAQKSAEELGLQLAKIFQENKIDEIRNYLPEIDQLFEFVKEDLGVTFSDEEKIIYSEKFNRKNDEFISNLKEDRSFVVDENIRNAKISLLINEKTEDKITYKEIYIFFNTPEIKHTLRFHKALSFDGIWKLASASYFFN